MAGFKTYGSAERIINIVFPLYVSLQSVARIDMNGRFGGINLHFPSAFGIVYPCRRAGVITRVAESPCMIVAVYDFQLSVVVVDMLAESMRLGEIQRCTLYRPEFSGYTFLPVVRRKIGSIYPHRLVFHAAVQVARQVKKEWLHRLSTVGLSVVAS